jgi:hypothetical protein
MEAKTTYDEKNDILTIQVKNPDMSLTAISPSGKSHPVASIAGEKLSIKGKVVTVSMNAYVTIPKAERK